MFERTPPNPENLSLTAADRAFLYLDESASHDQLQRAFHQAADNIELASELTAKASALKTRARRRRLLHDNGRFAKPMWD